MSLIENFEISRVRKIQIRINESFLHGLRHKWQTPVAWFRIIELRLYKEAPLTKKHGPRIG